MLTLYKNKNKTFLKYFLSYFIILTISFIGFFSAVQLELKNVYFKALNTQNEMELNNLYELIRTRLIEINQIHLLLQKDTNLLLSRYTNESYAAYQASNELQKHIVSNILIEDIIFLDYINKSSLSSRKLTQYRNGEFCIFFDNRFRQLPLSEWKETKGTLINWKSETENLLLYCPDITSDKYSIVYVINVHELNVLLNTVLSSSITSVCMTDTRGRIITGINTDEVSKYLSNEKKLDKNMLSYDLSNKPPSFGITAIADRSELLDSVQNAFQNTYIILFGIGLIGFAFIFFSMKLTYHPLRKLTKKISPNEDATCGYLEQISDAFDATLMQKQQLQNKINNYRLIMQKSILDSLILNDNNSAEEDITQIDLFFNDDNSRCILAIKILHNKQVTEEEIKEYISSSLPMGSACIFLETSDLYSVFLINYSGMELHKEKVIQLLLQDYYEDTGCLSAISNSTSNPLEIPTLYENAILAATYLNEASVVYYPNIALQVAQKPDVSYPYKKLELLSIALGDLDFPKAAQILNELFSIINRDNNPDFFVRCVLIDILTLIINIMNQSNIKFDKFSEVYYETLYFCRSCKYSEKSEEITQHISMLLSLLESEIDRATLHMSQVQQFIQTHYLSADFSVSMLADHFQVSSAYMSFLFKKKNNSNLSNYIWDLRLEKAKDLLCNTDLSIDEISITVGYENTSSFRRKFKQTTNVAPSMYRQCHSL